MNNRSCGRSGSWALVLALAVCGCGEDASTASDETGAADDTTGQSSNSANAGQSGSSGQDDQQQSQAEGTVDLFAADSVEPIEVSTVDRAKVESAADADAKIKEVREFYNQSKVPEVLQPPYSREAMRQYLEAMKFLKAQRAVDAEWLKAIDAEALTGGDEIAAYNLNNLRDNVLSRLEEYLPRDLEYSETNTREILAINLQNDIDFVKRGADADPTKDYDVNNILTDDGDMRLRDQAIDRLAGVLPLAIMLDQQLGVESAWAGKKKEINAMVAQYRRNLREATTAVTPPADLGDAELTRIATQVLTDPDMGLPKAERIIVNFPKQQKNRTEYVVDDGAITKVVRRWDEFQAVTIEKADNGRFYLYYNDILYYQEGPHTVPLNKWVLGPRFQGAPILEENINQ